MNMPHPQFLFDVSGELLVTNGTFSEECSAFFSGWWNVKFGSIPPDSKSGKWRFIGIPYWTSKTTGGVTVIVTSLWFFHAVLCSGTSVLHLPEEIAPVIGTWNGRSNMKWQTPKPESPGKKTIFTSRFTPTINKPLVPSLQTVLTRPEKNGEWIRERYFNMKNGRFFKCCIDHGQINF